MIYIGKKKSNRFQPTYFGSGLLIKEAIEEYGKDNFKVEIIKECLSEADLNKFEQVYIDCYKSQDRKIGYNITNGGLGLAGYKKLENNFNLNHYSNSVQCALEYLKNRKTWK